MEPARRGRLVWSMSGMLTSWRPASRLPGDVLIDRSRVGLLALIINFIGETQLSDGSGAMRCCRRTPDMLNGRNTTDLHRQAKVLQARRPGVLSRQLTRFAPPAVRQVGRDQPNIGEQCACRLPPGYPRPVQYRVPISWVRWHLSPPDAAFRFNLPAALRRAVSVCYAVDWLEARRLDVRAERR